MNDPGAAADVALNTIAVAARRMYGNSKEGRKWLAMLNDLVEMGVAAEIAGDLEHRFRGDDEH